MAGQQKGFMSGGMKFGVGDDADGPTERSDGPLMPLRMLLITELVPRADFNAGASAPDLPVEVDPSNFDGLFASLRPRLAVEVPSVLHEGGLTRIELSPTTIKSFRPDGLCAEVPLLKKLIDGRMVLGRLNDGTVTAEQARVELERLWDRSPFAAEILGLLPEGPRTAGQATRPAAAASESGPSSSHDPLFDMVDMGGGSASAPESTAPTAPARPDASQKLASIVAQVAKSARGGGKVRPTDAINRLENAIGVQVGAILQHPEVRRIEQAWRGALFVADRAKGIAGLQLDVLSTSEHEMADALRTAASNTRGRPAIAAAIVDTTIDGTAAGFTRLEAIASAGEENTLPVVVNGSEGLLGVSNLDEIDRLDNRGGLFTAPARAPWRSAAAKHCMRWVTIAMNPVLSRVAFTKSTSRVREAPIAEQPAGDDANVFIAPAFVVGSLIVQSFKQTSWPCRITGPRDGGLVENLTVREVEHGSSTVAIPTQVFVSTDAQREMAKSGVLLLASQMNNDSVYLIAAPTAYVTPEKRTYDSATTEPEVRLEPVSLGDQLFVARLVQFSQALCATIPASSDPAEVQPVLEGALWALFEDGAPAGPQLSVKTKPGAVEITVRPRRFLGVALDELAFELPLG